MVNDQILIPTLSLEYEERKDNLIAAIDKFADPCRPDRKTRDVACVYLTFCHSLKPCKTTYDSKCSDSSKVGVTS